jgi:hypothetical protein
VLLRLLLEIFFAPLRWFNGFAVDILLGEGQKKRKKKKSETELDPNHSMWCIECLQEEILIHASRGKQGGG